MHLEVALLAADALLMHHSHVRIHLNENYMKNPYVILEHRFYLMPHLFHSAQ